ncbi:MAG TPA: NUDIX domain-containing protein [Candidatus Saccharimonadales bacterium]|nr:NUDIX domain-containing protein [Candidatus Saccharimonadales bacterium]
MDDDELLDLVDSKDRVIGTTLRSQADARTNKQFLRAAEAFIQNRRGELWIPRRQPHKRIAPGGLDYSMGEHVKSGEDYLQACLRGFKEELNLDLKPKQLKFIRIFAPNHELGYFRALYIYESDVAPDYNPEDFSEWSWLTPAQLLAKLKTGEAAKLSLAETAGYLAGR